MGCSSPGWGHRQLRLKCEKPCLRVPPGFFLHRRSFVIRYQGFPIQMPTQSPCRVTPLRHTYPYLIGDTSHEFRGRINNFWLPRSLVDSDLVVGLGLLSIPAHCSAPESPLILDPDGRQEERAIGEDLSHAIPGASLGRQDLPSFCPACVQFPFQLLGRFLGSTLTVQHQWLPDPGCDVLTAYHCPWETAPKWRGQKRWGLVNPAQGG